MDEISSSALLIIIGLGLGFIMGATARGARFCTFGAVEDFVLARKTLRLKAWALAIAIALIGVQLLHYFGMARIEETTYLSSNFSLVGAVFGGLLFGLGMSIGRHLRLRCIGAYGGRRSQGFFSPLSSSPCPGI